MRSIKYPTTLAIFALAAIFLARPAPAAEGRSIGKGATACAANEVTWTAAPPMLPAGSQIAVLEGDPMKPGPFTVRLKMPAGARLMPHSHSQFERLTILEGDFHAGMGDTFDAARTQAYGKDAFLTLEPNMRHFAYTDRGAIVQISGQGPLDISYVNPKDDPRNAMKR